MIWKQLQDEGYLSEEGAIFSAFKPEQEDFTLGLDEFKNNTQKFMDGIASTINSTLKDMMLVGIKYEKIDGQIYEMHLFEEEELISYLDNLVKVNADISIYDYVEVDSQVERKFANKLTAKM